MISKKQYDKMMINFVDEYFINNCEYHYNYEGKVDIILDHLLTLDLFILGYYAPVIPTRDDLIIAWIDCVLRDIKKRRY